MRARIRYRFPIVAGRDDADRALRARGLDRFVRDRIHRPAAQAHVQEVATIGDRHVDRLRDVEIRRPCARARKDAIYVQRDGGRDTAECRRTRSDDAGDVRPMPDRVDGSRIGVVINRADALGDHQRVVRARTGVEQAHFHTLAALRIERPVRLHAAVGEREIDLRQGERAGGHGDFARDHRPSGVLGVQIDTLERRRQLRQR